MQLVSKTELQSMVPGARLRAAEVRDRYAIDIDDADYGETFLFYLIFTDFPDLLAVRVAPSEVFYNRFNWFVQFALLYMAKHGADVGLEQEYFHLLDEAEMIDGVDIEAVYQLRLDICGDRSFLV